jgi:hypothetical protein
MLDDATTASWSPTRASSVPPLTGWLEDWKGESPAPVLSFIYPEQLEAAGKGGGGGIGADAVGRNETAAAAVALTSTTLRRTRRRRRRRRQR